LVPVTGGGFGVAGKGRIVTGTAAPGPRLVVVPALVAGVVGLLGAGGTGRGRAGGGGAPPALAPGMVVPALVTGVAGKARVPLLEVVPALVAGVTGLLATGGSGRRRAGAGGAPPDSEGTTGIADTQMAKTTRGKMVRMFGLCYELRRPAY
jgi:hypothetical protein